jgi:hypothetical protein
LWLFSALTGRLRPKPAHDEMADFDKAEEEAAAADAGSVDDDDSEDIGKKTPSTDSAEDFELLEKSVDELGGAKTSGSQKPGAAKKRKGKKR